jgi:hypothetical protein
MRVLSKIFAISIFLIFCGVNPKTPPVAVEWRRAKKSLLIEVTGVLYPASPCSVALSRTCHSARLWLNKILVGKMIKRVGSIRAYLETSLSPFRSAKKRFRLPPRRPLKWCPSMSGPASGRRLRPILATLIRRRFLTSTRLKLRHQPNDADHQQQRPRRNKPSQDEKENEDSEAIHGWEMFFCLFPRFLRRLLRVF